jgi:transcriptional regulator with AAA-type ATPase domain/polyferredoxin
MKRPIGHYILHAIKEKAGDLSGALREQEELRRSGEERLLGQLLLGSGSITAQDLDRCLVRQRADVFGALDLFEALPRETVDRLASATTTEVLPPGQAVFRQGDPGDGYYIVSSGRVQVIHESSNGNRTTLAQLGDGEGFGEMALLTGEPRVATVETLERTGLIHISRSRFEALIAENPRIARAFARVLSERLKRGNVQLLHASSVEQAYRGFIADASGPSSGEFIGSVPAAVQLREQIRSAAEADFSVLVYGEPGCELCDVGSLVHHGSKRSGSMLLSMDSIAADGHGASAIQTGAQDPRMVEIAQWCVLFGRRRNALSHAPEPRLGIVEVARDGAVIIEHVDSLSLKMQELLADLIETGRFRPYGEEQERIASVRIIATTHAHLDVLATTGHFSPRLFKYLAAQVLNVPPLRMRKRDLPKIVAGLLEARSRALGKAITGMTEDASQAILAYDWPGNRDELESVIGRAVNISRGPKLAVEDLFIGPPPVTGRFTFNLLSLGWTQRLFRESSFLRIAQTLLSLLIALIIAAGLFGTPDHRNNVAVVLTWGIWEPLIVLGTLFVARGWCGVCPIGALNASVSGSIGLKWSVPCFLKRYGHYVAAAGIAIIFWAEHAAGMLRSPQATALLILSIVILAGVAGLLFQRRTWCRYLCPLGGMIGSISTCSAVELRSNFNMCTIECRDHQCRTAVGRDAGCPVFEAPFSLRSNQHCVLCGECIRACPKGAPLLNVRIPGAELWNARAADRTASVLGIALVGTQIFRMADLLGLLQGRDGSEAAWWVSALAMAGAVAAAFLVVRFIAHTVFRGDSAQDQVLDRSMYALLPTAAATEMAYHLERFLTLGGELVSTAGRQMGIGIPLPPLSTATSTVHGYQSILLIAGTAASLLLARKYARDSGRADFRVVRDGWIFLVTGIFIATTFLFT